MRQNPQYLREKSLEMSDNHDNREELKEAAVTETEPLQSSSSSPSSPPSPHPPPPHSPLPSKGSNDLILNGCSNETGNSSKQESSESIIDDNDVNNVDDDNIPYIDYDDDNENSMLTQQEGMDNDETDFRNDNDHDDDDGHNTGKKRGDYLITQYSDHEDNNDSDSTIADEVGNVDEVQEVMTRKSPTGDDLLLQVSNSDVSGKGLSIQEKLNAMENENDNVGDYSNGSVDSEDGNVILMSRGNQHQRDQHGNNKQGESEEDDITKETVAAGLDFSFESKNAGFTEDTQEELEERYDNHTFKYDKDKDNHGLQTKIYNGLDVNDPTKNEKEETAMNDERSKDASNINFHNEQKAQQHPKKPLSSTVSNNKYVSTVFHGMNANCKGTNEDIKENTPRICRHVLKYRQISFSVPTSTSRHVRKTNILKSWNSTEIGGGTNKERILCDISGEVCSGQTHAILGPSGAGKTSLLKTLTLQNFDGICTGSVQLDGEDMSMEIFKEKCAIVEQHDTLWPILTTKQHLQYAADFIFLNRVNQTVPGEKEAVIEDLLDTLDLRVCIDTRASNLSGGQKRRLSLAIVMMKAPQVLFLDEPTSGLDATSAATVVNSLKQLAQLKNLIVICTIHQPSSKIFNSFSHISLLAKGKSIYSGLNGGHVLSYFEEAGYSLPTNTNPAEFLIECVSSITDTSTLPVIGVGEHDEEEWSDNPHSFTTTSPDIIIYDLSAVQEKGSNQRTINSQLFILVSRMFFISIRDIRVYFARAAFFLFLTIFISIFYLQTRDRTVDLAVERVVQLGWFIAVPSLLMIVHVYQSCIEYTKMSHEVRLGFYNPMTYILARVIVEIPFMFMLTISALGIGGFVVAKLNMDAFWAVILLYTSMLYAFEALAQVCSAVFRDTNVNMLLFVTVWFGFFLFSEIWIAESDVILALRPFFYLSPFRLGLRAFIYLDYNTATFSCGDGLSLVQVINGGKCVGDYNGKFLLDAIGDIIFPTVTSTVNVAQCLGSTALITLGMKIMYAFLIKYRLSASTKLSSTTGLKRNGKNISCIKISKLLASAFIITGVSFGVIILISSKEIAFGAQECMMSLHDLGYRLNDFGNYEKFFNQGSTMILPQAGKYHGPIGILEYVLFLSSASHYLITSDVLRTDRHFLGYSKESGICSFREISMIDFKFDYTNTGSKVEYFATAMVHVELNPEEQVIENIYVDLEGPFLSFFYGELAKTDDTRKFVCSVMMNDCTMQEENCMQKLSMLPLLGEAPHFHFDGNSQGCRFLHAIMAKQNRKHCAHLAFEPTPDANGDIKCQESLGLLRTDFFDKSEIESHRIFQKNVGIEAGDGYKVHNARDELL